MSKGPENTFIASVHAHLQTDAPYKMKNHNSYIGGIADVWYSGNANDVWIEYKFVKNLPAKIDLTDVKNKYALSALQQKWLRDRYDEGRDVRVILGCTHGGVMFIERSWECSLKIERAKILTRQQLASKIYELTMGEVYAPVSRPSRKRLERVV